MNKLITTLPKCLVLALTAGLGCFVAALVLGEPFLAWTDKQALPTPPVQSQAVCLTIDVSTSMADNGKLNEVKLAAKNFVNRRDLSMDTIAVVSFSGTSSTHLPFSNDRQAILSAIDKLQMPVFGDGTNFEAAVQNSQSVVKNTNGAKNILLFTDGQSNAGNDRNAKSIASTLRSQGVKIFAIGTNDADTPFLSALTGDMSQVIGTADGQFEQAFAQAEKLIYSKGLMDSGGAYSFKETLIRVCVWTAFLCFGIAVFIKMIQNKLLKRKEIIRPQNVIAILIATAIVGALAGGGGQIIYSIVSYFDVPYADRIIAWALLGGMSAYGLAFFIPNLNKAWAWKSGALGGGLGAIVFIYLTGQLGDIGGRLTGAFILGFCIGLMVGMIEAVCRDAFLKITYNGGESTTLNLGERPVTFGSGRSDIVYVSGLTENAVSFHLDHGQIICYRNGAPQKISINDNIPIGNVTVEVCGTLKK